MTLEVAEAGFDPFPVLAVGERGDRGELVDDDDPVRLHHRRGVLAGDAFHLRAPVVEVADLALEERGHHVGVLDHDAEGVGSVGEGDELDPFRVQRDDLDQPGPDGGGERPEQRPEQPGLPGAGGAGDEQVGAADPEPGDLAGLGDPDRDGVQEVGDVRPPGPPVRRRGRARRGPPREYVGCDGGHGPGERVVAEEGDQDPAGLVAGDVDPEAAVDVGQGFADAGELLRGLPGEQLDGHHVAVPGGADPVDLRGVLDAVPDPQQADAAHRLAPPAPVDGVPPPRPERRHRDPAGERDRVGVPPHTTAAAGGAEGEGDGGDDQAADAPPGPHDQTDGEDGGRDRVPGRGPDRPHRRADREDDDLPECADPERDPAAFPVEQARTDTWIT